MKIKTAAIILFGIFPLLGVGQTGLYKVTEGRIHFVSDAPLEYIEAESSGLKGVIDVNKRQFAFTIGMQSFLGFNSPLQREHFNENYLESDQYPNATFAGEIIEKIDFEKNGTYEVRAKGKLVIHGKSRDRIIKSQIIVEDNKLIVSSNFTVLLEEHNIVIPRIVYQKIAEEIQVEVKAIFEKQKA